MTIQFLKNLCISPLTITLMALAILLSTFVMEYGFDVPLCRMCIFERYPYVVAIVIGTFLSCMKENKIIVQGLTSLLILTFFISIGLSLYHVGLEYGWFDLPLFCKGSLPKAETIEALRAQILNQKTFIPCNLVPIRILGLSLAAWNAISSMLLFGLSWALLGKK